MMIPSAHRHALPEGTRLEEYRIDRVLGSGGFGITYLAWDENMARPVAIKEYLPSDLAVREQNLSVYAKSTRDEEIYGWGLDRFREEAQTLARFDHPHIVRVLRFLTANNTAYMVMQYVEGETLGDVLKRRGVLGEEELRGFMVPLLNGLEAVHEAGILHRDIKPGNIYVRKDGSPVLLDFGAARQSIQGRTRSMTAVLTPPYAPFEQYGKTQKQGPWTDIYAFSAVLYQAVSGKLPPDAPDRVADEDPFEPTARVARGRYSQDLFGAIDHALKPRGSDRPQSIEQWRNALWPAAKPNPPRPAIPQPSPAHATIGKAVGKSDADPNVEDDDKVPDSKRALALRIVCAIACFAAVVVFFVLLLHNTVTYRDAEFNNEIDAANAALVQKDYSTAIDHYTKAIALEPTKIELYNGIANEFEAIEEKQSEPYLGRGIAYEGLGQHGDAITDYTEAIRLYPTFAVAYFKRGQSYYSEGQTDSAIDDFTKAIKLQSDKYGDVISQLNMYAQCTRQNALPDACGGPNIYAGRGLAYEKKGQRNKAIADYRAALELDPDRKAAQDLKRLGAAP